MCLILIVSRCADDDLRFTSQDMALPGSYDTSSSQVSGLGVHARVPYSLQCRFRTHCRAAKYWFGHPGDENHSTWSGVEGVPDLSYLDRQG